MRHTGYDVAERALEEVEVGTVPGQEELRERAARGVLALDRQRQAMHARPALVAAVVDVREGLTSRHRLPEASELRVVHLGDAEPPSQGWPPDARRDWDGRHIPTQTLS